MNRMTGATFAHGVLADGNAVTVSMVNADQPATIWTFPVAGDTVTVTYSTDGGVNFHTSAIGAVTAYTEDVRVGPLTHVKFQRTAGAGVTSAYGIC